MASWTDVVRVNRHGPRRAVDGRTPTWRLRQRLLAVLVAGCTASPAAAPPSSDTAGSERPSEVARQAETLCRVITEEPGTGIEGAARIYERLEREVTHPGLRDAFTALLGASDGAASQRFRGWLAANGAPTFVCPALDRLVLD